MKRKRHTPEQVIRKLREAGCSVPGIEQCVCAQGGYESCCEAPPTGTGWDDDCRLAVEQFECGVCAPAVASPGGHDPTATAGAGDTITTSAEYDGEGNMLTCTYPGGRVVTTTYEELNRKKVISDAAMPSIAEYVAYQGPYLVWARRYANEIWTEYEYDNVRRMTGTTHDYTPPTPDVTRAEFTYTWDEMYNKASRTNMITNTKHSYVYDPAYRLEQSLVFENS